MLVHALLIICDNILVMANKIQKYKQLHTYILFHGWVVLVIGLHVKQQQ